MSVRVHFKPEFIDQLRLTVDRQGNHCHRYNSTMQVSVDNEGIHCFLGLHLENVTVSGLFPADAISGYSVQDYVHTTFLRTMGRYQHRGAIAYVSDASSGSPGGRSPGYWLNMTSDNLDDMKKLHELILAGAITPAVSYEKNQVEPVTGHVLRFIERLSRFERSVRTAWNNRMLRSA